MQKLTLQILCVERRKLTLTIGLCIEAVVALWQPAFIKYAERIKFPEFFSC